MILAAIIGRNSCTGQTIGSTMGYNGGIYTTIEAGLRHKKLSTAVYLAIPYWRSGDMNYHDKLYSYKQLGYFAGVRVQYVLNKLFIGGAVQYEKYCLNMHTISTYPDAIKRGELKDWKIRPYACVDYQLHPNISAGCNLGKFPDVHVRFQIKIKQP